MFFNCVSVCKVPTGLKGGALGCHAPSAGAAAFGHHDRELIQGVWLQSRHHVVQTGGVGHLGTDAQELNLYDCTLNMLSRKLKIVRQP